MQNQGKKLRKKWQRKREKRKGEEWTWGG